MDCGGMRTLNLAIEEGSPDADNVEIPLAIPRPSCQSRSLGSRQVRIRMGLALHVFSLFSSPLVNMPGNRKLFGMIDDNNYIDEQFLASRSREGSKFIAPKVPALTSHVLTHCYRC